MGSAHFNDCRYARGETYAIILVYPLAIFTAGLILNARSAILCFFITSITYAITVRSIHIWGSYLEYSESTMDLNNHLVLITSLFVVLLLTWLFTGNMQRYIERLESGNREKEILLKEIHHRVKNNLQIVTSLLNLQGESLTDEHSRKVFENSVGRIKSMALVHEKLYRSDNFSKIVLYEYISDLLATLGPTYKSTPHIEIKCDIDATELVLEQSLSIGLIVNELVTNSIKHAFEEMPVGFTPQINVSFKNSGSYYELTVSDNGKGISNETTKDKPSTLGLQLVMSLVDELEGSIAIDGSSGTEIKIKFDTVGG